MTVAERINAERIVLAGWSRAILLQLAHPLVAAGVSDHSSFRGGLLSASIRLHHTVGAMRRLTFGTGAQAQSALDGIIAIHRRVHGTLPAAAGPFPAGTRYSAEDPALVLWVHATLLESLPLVYDALVAPLSRDDRDTWCRESAPVAHALGAGDDVPVTWRALQDYLDRMHTSGQIVVSDTARAVAAEVLSPRLAGLVAPARAINRLVTSGLLPPDIRAQYGFAWTARDDRRLHRTLRWLRRIRQVTPDLLAHWPDARRHAR
ncbi:MAG: oxygenase MpaB family protein [Luteitalea sp.]|nr:DUF2236 domain-containing protein [Acidobacteriota bacterium]